MEYLDARKLRREVEIREMLKQTTIYINAGGRGSRMESILGKDPTKALIEIKKNEPIVKYHLNRFLRLGFHGVVVGAGDHKDIKDYFQSHGLEKENVEVTLTDRQEGSGGDLIKAVREGKVSDKYILVQNVDTLIDLNEKNLLLFHKEKNAGVTAVLTTRLEGPYTRDTLVDSNGKIIFSRETSDEYQIEKPVEYAYGGTYAGTLIFNTEKLRDFNWQTGKEALDLYSQIVGNMIRGGEAYAFDNGKNFVIDVGTPERYKKAARHPIIQEILDRRSE